MALKTGNNYIPGTVAESSQYCYAQYKCDPKQPKGCQIAIKYLVILMINLSQISC